MRSNLHVNISEQFTIRECMIPSLEGSVNMDLQEDVDENDYLRKEVSCSNTRFCSHLKKIQWKSEKCLQDLALELVL